MSDPSPHKSKPRSRRKAQESEPSARRPGRPRAAPLPKLSREQIHAALARVQEIWDRRGEGTRFGDFPFPSPGRTISVHEAMAKIKQIKKLTGLDPEGVLRDWDRLSGEQHEQLETLVVRYGRTELPRAGGARNYTWRRLENDLFAMVKEAEGRGKMFAEAPPVPEMAKKYQVGMRGFLKAIQKVRDELEINPGMWARVNLWLGRSADTRVSPSSLRLWVSRVQGPSIQDAAAQGLLPANTAEQAAASRNQLLREAGR